MTPFYEKAKNLWQRTQDAQIQKGLQKYPEPFNPHSWTPDELLNHALEETVDLTHYLVGLKELLDAKDQEIEQLKKELNGYKFKEKYQYRPVTGDPLSPVGPFIKKKECKPRPYDMNFNPAPYFDPDDQ